MNNQEQYCKGMSAYNAGRYAEAVDHLMPLMTAQHVRPAILSRFYVGQAHYRMAMQLLSQRKYQDASHHFHAAAQANPQGGGFGRFLAACHLGSGRFDLAGKELETMLQQDPADTSTRIRLALTQWKQGNHIEAVSTLRDGVQRQAQNAELCYQLGVMLASDDELIEAESCFQRTISMDPTHAGAFERLAQCCSIDNRSERALRYLERAHHLDAGNARIAWQLSLLAQSMTEAKDRPAVQWRPSSNKLRIDESAIDRLGDAIIAEPDFVQAFLSLPVSEADEEVFSTLAATLERALQKRPEFADLHYHCGVIYRRLGRSQDALQHAEKAVQLNPRYVNALILVAQMYGQTDRCMDGIERLEQALEAGGDYPDVHYLMGQLCQTVGEISRAKEEYQRALELNEHYNAARTALTALAA